MILTPVTLAIGASATPFDAAWATLHMKRLGIEHPEAGGSSCWAHPAYRESTLAFIRGREAELAGSGREAALAFQEAVSHDPANEAAWLGLARIGRAARDSRLAEAAWVKRLELCPRDPQALRVNANRALRDGHLRDALELMLRHRAESPELNGIQEARWNAAIAAGLAERGAADSARELNEHVRGELVRMASQLESNRTTRRQWEWLVRHLAIEGSRSHARAAAHARLTSGRLDMAADRGRMTSMCIVLNAMDEDASATEDLLRSLPQDDLRLRLEFRAPVAPATMLFRASTIHAALGDRAGAIELLKDAAAIDSGIPGVLNNLGYMMLERDPHSDAAAEYLEQALTLDPEDAGTLDSVGYLRLLQGRIEDAAAGAGALSLLRSAARRTDHMDPIILLHLGDAEAAAGLEQAARSTWRHALALLEHPEFKAERIRSYDAVQSEDWGIRVVPSEHLYHLEFGEVGPTLRARLAGQHSAH
ncbi:MAG: hypothetical protein QF561_03040 [Phycisphaerales bacterium]|nr:hypothetical protein [Phycisphaerales bacterium]